MVCFICWKLKKHYFVVILVFNRMLLHLLFYDLQLKENWEKIFSLWLHSFVWLIALYGIEGCVPYYIKKCWDMDLCHTQDITTIIISQIICVKLCKCTKLGRNIVGEVCPNNVTWFCACLCRKFNEDTINYVCCNILCITCSLLQF